MAIKYRFARFLIFIFLLIFGTIFLFDGGLKFNYLNVFIGVFLLVTLRISKNKLLPDINNRIYKDWFFTGFKYFFIFLGIAFSGILAYDISSSSDKSLLIFGEMLFVLIIQCILIGHYRIKGALNIFFVTLSISLIDMLSFFFGNINIILPNYLFKILFFAAYSSLLYFVSFLAVVLNTYGWILLYRSGEHFSEKKKIKGLMAYIDAGFDFSLARIISIGTVFLLIFLIIYLGLMPTLVPIFGI